MNNELIFTGALALAAIRAYYAWGAGAAAGKITMRRANALSMAIVGVFGSLAALASALHIGARLDELGRVLDAGVGMLDRGCPGYRHDAVVPVDAPRLGV